MVMIRHGIVRILAVILALVVCINVLALGQQRRNAQKVFIDWGGVNHELVIDLSNGLMRIRKAKVLEAPLRYRVDGLEFLPDKIVIEENYKKNETGDKLTTYDGALFYEGRPVTLPRGVEMRKVWQAVSWKGWIICLGRTSKTDREAQLRPPFLATEIITFSARERTAAVQYLTFEPPSGIRLFILDPKHR
jgi:hypothetical protein